MMRILAFLLLILFLPLAGCGLLPDQIDETRDWPASRLYNRAKEALNAGNYSQAIQYFEKLEARFPYGPYAQQAQLEIAYAYYKDNEPVSAIAAADRFIKLYPNHPHVDYAYYLKGLANFVEDHNLFARLGGQDMSERDPKAAREAFEAFRELAERFPDSRYTPDALARMRYLVNALAAHEVHVARYYLKRGAPVAAVNRGKYVLEHYPNSPAVEEALAIMMQGYARMGLDDLAADTRRVLQHNFPDSPWLSGAGPAPARKTWWRFW